jgi:hypothetical protein
VSVVLEEDALAEWLVGYLEADTTLMGMLNGHPSGAAVFPEVIPDQGKSPYVRVDFLDGEDLMVIGGHRVWVSSAYHIRGCFHWQGGGRPDRTDVNAIGNRLDTLLHFHEALTATHQIHGFREDPEPNPAVVEANGELWLQSGGVYRLRVGEL